jgi:hypothetical protein
MQDIPSEKDENIKIENIPYSSVADASLTNSIDSMKKRTSMNEVGVLEA